MTYQSLYNKYRSGTFADLVGQEAISRALQGAIASERVSHAYLFSGSRGTGKTTTARLLAKALNCLQRAPGSAEPCGVCPSCLAVASGTHLDLIEIDAASNRGIDDIRELRDKVRLAPSQGRYKVYILDEAHMLTVEACNALLKTLEEPPPHAVFVLCTTDAQKLPLTIVARCQQFPFRRHAVSDIEARLSHIASAEGVSVDRDALELLARTSEGSLRDAIGYLDQLVPLASGSITLEEARSILGIADPLAVSLLFALVVSGQAHEALHSLSSLYEAGVELRPLVRGLMERCRDELVNAITASDVTPRARLSSILDGLLKLDGEVRRHAEPRFLVEATLVRLAAESSSPAAAVAPAVAPVPEPEAAPEPVVAGPVEPATSLKEAWERVLVELTPSARGVMKQGQVEFAEGVVKLVYRYKGQYDVAASHADKVRPLVAAQFGSGTRIEFELLPLDARGVPSAGGPASSPTRPRSPEEDPRVREALSAFEGSRVVNVREIKE